LTGETMRPARPAIQHDAPGLRDEQAACRDLDFAARACDERRDQLVVGVMLDAQPVLRFRERDRLNGGRCQKNGGHGLIPVISLSRCLAGRLPVTCAQNFSGSPQPARRSGGRFG